MSEHLPQGGEHLPNHQTEHKGAEHHRPTHEQVASGERQQAALAKEMQKMSESLAQSSEDISLQQHGENKPQSHSFGVHKELKLQNYKRLLGRVQSRLKGPEKALSKTIHNKQVDAISDVGAKTVARPWGIMVGGLSAFIGSLVVLVFARRYGFTYNFSLFIMLFLGGYILGTLLEGLGKLVKRSGK